tara:strand:+ start:3268 stop:8136 length:4869 start_codon:yes stop_codon:yes gene_type:complete
MSHHTAQAWLTQNPNLAEGEESEKVPAGPVFPELPEDFENPAPKKSNWLTDVGGPVFGLIPERVTDPGYMARFEHRNPTTEELIALEKADPSLIRHTDGRLKYQPTPEFMDYLRKERQTVSNFLMATPAGAFTATAFSAAEQYGKGATYGREQISQRLFGLDKEDEQFFLNQLAKKRNELGRDLDYFERQDLWNQSFERGGMRTAESIAYEMTLPAIGFEGALGHVTGKTLGWGFKAVPDGISWVGGKLFRRSGGDDVPGAVPDVVQTIKAPESNIYNVKDVKVSLTKKENILTNLIEIVGGNNSVYDDFVDNAIDSRARAIDSGENLAASISSEVDYLIDDAFQIADNGTIPNLPPVQGMKLPPTIADVAANYPAYSKFLTNEQHTALHEVRRRLRPIEDTLKELEVDLGTRHDIAEGGFYIPRGGAESEFIEETAQAGIGKGGAGHKKTAKFSSQSEGIEKGFKYDSFKDAVETYVRKSGVDVGDTFMAKVLKEARDADGNLIGSTMATRLARNPVFIQSQKLTKKILSKRNTVLGRIVRSTTLRQVADRAARRAETAAEKGAAETERVRGRTTRAGAEAMERTQRAKGRQDAVAGKYSAADLKEARLLAGQAVTEGRELVRKILRNNEKLKRGKAKVRTSDKKWTRLTDKLQKDIDDLNNLARAVEADPAAYERAGGIGDVYDKMVRRTDSLRERVDKVTDDQINLEDRVQDMADEADRLAGMDKLSIQARRDMINEERALLKIKRTEERLNDAYRAFEKEEARVIKLLDKVEQRDINRIKAQIKKAHGDAATMDDNAIRSLINLYDSQDALKALKDEYQLLKSELARAKAIASETPRGMGEIRMPQFRGTAFPAELANRINKMIEAEAPTTGRGAWLSNAYQWHASQWRSLRATLDDSAMLIQGLLRLHDNPVLAAKAFVWHFRAWGTGGDKMLGSFLNDFNKKARINGRLTSDDLAALGVHIEPDTEFTIGRTIGKTPGIKQANRAFGMLGVRMRVEWADEIVQELLAEGRTLDEIKGTDLGREIGDAVNSATGHGSKKFGGNVGDFLFFAPRFFQARLENMGRAVKGTVKDPISAVADIVPGGGRARRAMMGDHPKVAETSIQERIARRSMLRMISQGTLLTAGINYALGNETDYRVMVKDKQGRWNYNSNFMRIRFKGRDYSIFGPYDSMLRMMVTLTAGPPQGQLPFDAFRGVAAGPVSLAWDLLSGETFEGEEPKSGWAPNDPEWLPGDDNLKRAAFILESHIPFAADEIPQAGERVAEGDIGGAISLAAGEVWGVKSAPLSWNDLLQEITGEKIAAGEKSPTARVGDEAGWDPDNLSEGELDIIKKDPRMVEYIDRLKAKKKDDLGLAFEQLSNRFVEFEQDLISKLNSGASPEDVGTAIKNLKRQRANEYKIFEDENKETLAEIAGDPDDVNRADYWAQKYFNLELDIDEKSGYMDFDSFEEDREEIIAAANRENPEFGEYITGRGLGTFRGERYEDPRVRAAIEEYDNDVEIMREYWDVTMRIAKFHGVEDEYKEYLKSTNKADYKKNGKHKKIIKGLEKEARKQKEYIRMRNPHLEAVLLKRGSITSPINPIVAGMVEQIRKDQRDAGQPGVVNLNNIQEYIDRLFVGQ